EERKFEPVAILLVQELQSCSGVLVELRQASSRLLTRRDRAHADSAPEIGMGTEQRELLGTCRTFDAGPHRVMKVCLAAKRPRGPRAVGHPGRMLEDPANRRHKLCPAQRVQLVERHEASAVAAARSTGAGST